MGADGRVRCETRAGLADRSPVFRGAYCRGVSQFFVMIADRQFVASMVGSSRVLVRVGRLACPGDG